MKRTPLIDVKQVSKEFVPGAPSTLEGITLQIYEGEFIALLGPSGCGKSTLLRILNGLLPASGGTIAYRGEVLKGPNPKSAMVFQSAALYPWLTVQENIELGLKVRGTAPEERGKRAASLIRLIGLDGFEDAYPKELSGGMRQRVALARALAVDPEVLCMDEPFATLDPLTAENLRDELLDLWQDGQMPIKCFLMVTHGIEEAVYMANRIIVLGRNPGRVAADIPMRLPYPRDRRSDEFSQMVDLVYKQVTAAVDQERVGKAEKAAPAAGGRPARFKRLPPASISMLTGLLELVDDHGGREDLYTLGGDLLLEVDDILPLTDAAELMGLARVEEADMIITELGKQFVEASAEEQKELFFRQIKDLPVFAMVMRVLKGKQNRTMAQQFFADLLEQQFGPEDGPVQLETLISWGRYAEMFHYDAGSEELYLDEGDRGLRGAESGS